MADRDPERTEKATGKRRKKARDDGSVPKSGQLTKTMVLIMGYIALRLSFSNLYEQMHEVWTWAFGHPVLHDVSPEDVMAMLVMLSKRLAIMLLPILLTIAATAYLVLRLQVGKYWKPKAFSPEWSKAFKFNFGAVFGIFKFDVRKLIPMGRQLGQAGVIGFSSYMVLKGEFPKFIPLFYADVPSLAAYILTTAQTMLWYSFIPMVVLAAADTWWTFYDYEENIKMTKFEVKDEMKQMEGDPTVKMKQREKMMKFMQMRMFKMVPQADVVITNPTHLAIALRYDVREAPAPVVLAKGADFVAQRIRDIATEHNIPIRENKPLARALYKDVEVGEMIPEELYQAVATIMAQLPKFRRSAA